MTEVLTWMHADPDKWFMTGGAMLVIAGLAVLVELWIDKGRK